MHTIFGLNYTLIQDGEKRLIFHKGSAIKGHMLESRIQTGKPKQIILPDIEEIDGTISFNYRIGALQSLNDYLMKNNISMMDYYLLLSTVARLVYQSNALMLSQNKFIIHTPQFIYIDGNIQNLHLIYVPLTTLEKNSSLAEDFVNLATKLYTRVKDPNPDSYSKLMDILQFPSFTLEAFINTLAILIGSPAHFDVASDAKGIIEPAPKSAALKAEVPQAKRKIRFVYLTLGLLLFGGSLTVHFYLDNEATFYISVVAAAVAAIFLLNSYKVPKNKIQAVPMTNDIVKQEQNDNPASQFAPLVSNIEPVHLDDATVLLGNQFNPIQMAYQLVFDNGQTFTVTRNETIIGRSEEQAHIVLTTVGVSRTHLKIIKNDKNELFIEDLGSKNKTKLNNKTLDGHTIYPLRIGDEVRFATEMFVVKVGD